MAGGFAGYQAEARQPDPVAKIAANYRGQRLTANDALAAGSGQALSVQHSHVSDTSGSKHSKSAPSASRHKPATTARVSATHHRRSGNAPSRPAPTASKSSSSSGSNLKAAVQKDIAAGNYELATAQYLVEHGYSKVGAAGVVGCIDGESGGNPESVGSGGGGLIGWTPISAAAPNANIITGNPATDMMTQLGDLLYYNSSEIGQSLVNQLNAQTDPTAAADFYSANFEKPAVLYSDVRPSTAQQILSELGG